LHAAERETRRASYQEGIPVENDEKTNEERQTDERDEMDDLDVTQQQAEDIKGGRRAIKHKDL
jgi:hypothetical protein